MSNVTIPEMIARVPLVPSLSITSPTPLSTLVCVILIAVFAGIDLLIIGLRIFVRMKRAGHFYLNDYLLFVGSILTIATSMITVAVVCQGVAGHHLIEVLTLVPERWPLTMQLTLAAEFGWIISVVFIKLSLLNLYLQVFGQDRRFLWAVRIIGVLVVILGVVATSLTATNCIPFKAYWNPFLPGSRCVSPRPSFLATGILSLAFDVAILILPMPKLWNLNMSTRKKLGLTFIFGIGFAICGIQAWRVQVIATYHFEDITYGLVFLGASTVFELELGVIVASIPVVSPAFRNTTFGFESLGSRLTVWMRGRTTGKSSISNQESSSLSELTTPNNASKPTESQVDRKNFKKLYDHIYPLSDLDGRSQVDTHVAVNTATFEGREEREHSGNIEVTRAWKVQY